MLVAVMFNGCLGGTCAVVQFHLDQYRHAEQRRQQAATDKDLLELCILLLGC